MYFLISSYKPSHYTHSSDDNCVSTGVLGDSLIITVGDAVAPPHQLGLLKAWHSMPPLAETTSNILRSLSMIHIMREYNTNGVLEALLNVRRLVTTEEGCARLHSDCQATFERASWMLNCCKLVLMNNFFIKMELLLQLKCPISVQEYSYNENTIYICKRNITVFLYYWYCSFWLFLLHE